MQPEIEFNCRCCSSSFVTSGYRAIYQYPLPILMAFTAFCPVCQTRIVKWVNGYGTSKEPATDNV